MCYFSIGQSGPDAQHVSDPSSMSVVTVIVFSLSGGGPSARSASQQAEVEGNRWVAFEPPTAHAARKTQDRAVAHLAKHESACQLQRKAAVDACVTSADTAGKVKEADIWVQLAARHWKRRGRQELISQVVGEMWPRCRTTSPAMVGQAPPAPATSRGLSWPRNVHQQQQPTQSVLVVPDAQPSPTLSLSASPRTTRVFASSLAVAVLVEPWAAPDSLNAREGGDESEDISIEDQDLERVLGIRCGRRRRSPGGRHQEAGAGGSPASQRQRHKTGRCRPKPKVDFQERTVGWLSLNIRVSGASKVYFLLAQDTHLPKDAVTTQEFWMRSQGWCVNTARSVSVAPAWRDGDEQANCASHGCRALRHGLSTPCGGVGDTGIELCKGCVLPLYHSCIVSRRGSCFLQFSVHAGAAVVTVHKKIGSTIDQ